MLKLSYGAVLEELDFSASSAAAGDDATGCGMAGASFLGGMRSFMASRPLASANVILWFGEKPAMAATIREARKLVMQYLFDWK